MGEIMTLSEPIGSRVDEKERVAHLRATFYGRDNGSRDKLQTWAESEGREWGGDERTKERKIKTKPTNQQPEK
jgi:hypothetical protein